jgi:sulfur transfer protein SufE
MAIRGGAAYLKVADASCRAIMTIDEINENFALLDEWDDRYRYLIELGRMLPPLPDAARIEANKVQGCASQVWLTTEIAPGTGRCSTSSATAAPISCAGSSPFC